jgi:endonuclease/exonuclease/phosphatase family metal-dependent hydrolase
MTYNIRRCVGFGGRQDPERVARVIESAQVDAAALQEVDALDQDGGDQARWLAERLGMYFSFVAARPVAGGHYGNAWLARAPLEVAREGALPCRSGFEARAVQWVRVDVGGWRLNLLNTHFGLDRRGRLEQADCLIGSDWTGSAECSGHTVLCGDLNALPHSAVLRRLTRRLRDAARVAPRRRGRATWPALAPVMRIDYVLASREIRVLSVEVPRDRLARVASDHRPVVVELELERHEGAA